MRAKLIRPAMKDNGTGKPQTRLKIGDTIENPDCYQLVQTGMAVPDDDECRAACGMTDDEIKRVIRAQDAVSKGIHPSDYQKFYSGEIAGYREDGSYIPGPNATTFEDDDDDCDSEE